MSVTTELYSVHVVGDGSAPSIAFNRKVFASTDIKGKKVVVSTGLETALVNGTDFTVSGAGDTSSSVTVTASAVIPVGTNWVIYTDAGATNSATFTTAGPFPAKTFEYQLDKAHIAAQEASGESARAMKFPITDPNAAVDLPGKESRKSKALAFDSDGNPEAISINNVSASNAAGITFDPAGAGAVASTVQDKLRERVSVKDFGATGDGTTDDRAAIVSAIAHVESLGGGTVFFPVGSYNIGSTGITVTSQGITLLGEGMGGQTSGKNGSRIIYTGSGAGVQLTTDSGNAWGVNLLNMHIDCNSSGAIGLKVGNDDGTVSVSWWGIIENVFITGATDAGFEAIGMQGGQVRKLVSQFNGGIGARFTFGTVTPGNLANTASTIQGMRCANNTGKGVVINQGFGLHFVDLISESNGGKNIEIDDTSSSTNLFFSGGWVENSSVGAGNHAVTINGGSATFDRFIFNEGTADQLSQTGGYIQLNDCFYSETPSKPTVSIGTGCTCIVTSSELESFSHFSVHANAKFSWNGRNRLTADEDPATASATQAFNRGDIVMRQGDTAFATGYPFGWICTASGSPGTWNELGTMRILHKTKSTSANPYNVSQFDATVLHDATAAARTCRLPALGTAPGKEYCVQKIDASGNSVVVAAQSGEKINGSGTHTLSTQWDSVTVRDVGTHWATV